MTKRSKPVPAIAGREPQGHSYLRFSDDHQSEGDSVRRQASGARRWSERTGVPLSGVGYHDLGVSAFKGKNKTHGALRAFREAIGATVRPGDYLIVENLDRISREGIDAGYDLIKEILRAGVHIVTLSPERTYGPDAVKGLMKGALEILILLELAHEESVKKSERVGEAWRQKKKRAREGALMSEQLPAWVRREGGGPVRREGDRLALIPERAEVVRRIFRLSAEGYGIPTIIRRLDADHVPAFGEAVVRAGRKRSKFSGSWNRSYLAIVLGDRRALGEYQPMRGGEPDGEPIPGYYPAAVTAEEYHAARAGMAQRRRNPGRTSDAQVNLFAGILYNARDGGRYSMTQCVSQTRGGGAGARRKFQILVNSDSHLRGGRAYSVRYDAVEGAVLALLREIDPKEVAPRPGATPDVARSLRDEKAAIEADLADLRVRLRGKLSPTLLDLVEEKETRLAEVERGLEDVRDRDAVPLAESWSRLRTLSDELAEAEDGHDCRLRIRAALRRNVESMWMLVVPRKAGQTGEAEGRGSDRVVALQASFSGGLQPRRWLMVVREPRGGRVKRPGGWWALSLAEAMLPGDHDLRDRGCAARLLADLGRIDPQSVIREVQNGRGVRGAGR